MAKKQTRRSISVSRTTYERLKAFCESNNISMSQLVETRVNDFLGPNDVAGGAPIGASIAGSTAGSGAPLMPRPMQPMPPRAVMSSGLSHGNGVAQRPLDARPVSHPSPSGHAGHGASHAGHAGHAGPATPAAHAPQPPAGPTPGAPGVPMTSAAARFAVEPPPPIIKPRQDTAAPKPAEKRPEQIFTF
jgi:hypothetical protein